MADISLINMKGISKVFNNLINKMSKATGWVFTHETPNRIATSYLIDSIKAREDIDSLTKAALISNSKTLIREYSNQVNIVDYTVGMLTPNAQPEAIEDDWIAMFLDKAKSISDEECQQLWARILYQECEKPGSVSRQLLNILSCMGRKEAKSFETVCNFSAQTGDVIVPVILQFLAEDYYPKHGLRFNDLVTLESLGLISVNNNYYDGYIHGVGKQVTYGKDIYKMPEGKDSVNVGMVVFTKAGDELSKIVGRTPIEGYFQSVLMPFWDYGDDAVEHINDIRVSLGLKTIKTIFDD